MMQLEDWLDDLCVRFIINIPIEELNSIERICFQIEEAQWYYEDFVRPNDPSLPSLSLKPFFNRITQRCPLFASWPQEDMGNAFERFLKYKNRVPVRGAILLNDKMDQVLLVKGYKKNGTWSFPRGKINKDEDDLDCAIREAWEETGLDIQATGLITDRRKIKSIEKTMRSQNMKLFVFRGVPQDAKFVPQTRKEISKVEWFKLADLPTEKRKNQAEGQAQLLNPNKFYVVAPFMHELKKIIAAERKRDNRQSSKLAQQPITAESVAAQQYPIPLVNNGPLSPAVPSNLPEVTPASAQNPIQHVLHPPNATAAAPASDADVKAKSHALLALLQKGSSAEMRNVPYPPLEQATFAAPPHSPERPITSSHPQADMLQSPPFDLYPAAHPAAPPPSALPQLNQHTRSLLDAFSRPSAAPADPSNQLSPAKQNLLAAFTSPRAAPQPTQSPGNNAGDNLLQLLKMNQLADAKPPAPPSSSIQPPAEPRPPIIPATEHPSQPVPAQSNANALLGLLQQKPQRAVQDVQIPKSYAAAAGTPARGSQTTTAKPRQSPVELSATANDEPKAQNTDKTKANLLSLLGSMSSKKPQSVGGKSRSGTTSATLDRPFDEPQFDAIAKTPTFGEEPKREPVSGHKKLFDPKQDQVKQLSSVKVLAQKDDRTKQPKSPRTARHQQGKSQRPVTPKEVQKPFQPQILKRPQPSEGEGPLGLPSLLTKAAAAEPKTSATVSPLSTLPSATSLSPGTIVPEAATPIRLADVFSNQSAVPHDPQREALLSLLKTPSQQPPVPDADATPKASLVEFVPATQEQPERRVSPPTASQLASPVMDGEEVSASRSRVSSLASMSNSGGRWPTEKRQTAPSDKAFLLNFLKGMAAETS